MTATVTVADLRRHHACKSAIALFRRTFPDGCRVTLANVRKAQRAGLNLQWATRYLLTEAGYQAFASAERTAARACIAAQDQAWKAYVEDRQYEAYKKTMREVENPHNAATARALVAAVKQHGLAGQKP